MTRPSAAEIFEWMGGEETFRRLVAEFYRGVADDPLLRPMYPEEDLGPAEDRLRMFLVQYWGGPNEYQLQRGHPRLRMRHAPFRIGAAERDAWLTHMHAAMETLDLAPGPKAQLWAYLVSTAEAMRNVASQPGP
jgi:hemoglobin